MGLYKSGRRARTSGLRGMLMFSLALACANAVANEPTLLTPSARSVVDVSAKVAPADRTVARQRPVHVDLGYLNSQTADGAAVTIELFDGQTIVIDPDRIEKRRPGSFTYFGRVRGVPHSPSQLTVVDGYLAGFITLRESKGKPKQYRIESNGDAVHWLQEVDDDAFPADHPPGEEIMIAPPESKALADVEPKLDGAAADSGSTIDVMVVYSNNVATAVGAAIGSQIQAAVDAANRVYVNSGVATQLRLVHYAQVNYAESGNFNTELTRLTSTGDGYLDEVHALRNTYGADLVSMFVNASSACGIGWVNSTAAYAFTVVSRGCATSNYSFVHELGHNLGARHDPYVDAATTPYAYGHGMVDLVARWRTVMSYTNACSAAGVSCPRIAHLSNPNVMYGVPGSPTGTVVNGTSPTSNNARVHNERAYTVANFRLSGTGGCTYALSPSALSLAAAGGNASSGVTAGAGCAWNAASSASWLTVGGTATSGSGTLSVSATANPGQARSATVSVGNQTVTVTQASGCSYTVSPTSISASAAGGSGTVSVTTTSGCTWTASSGASWATITSGASGSGSGTVSYSVAPNSGGTRSGNLSVAAKTVIVTQSAAAATAAATLSPSSLSFRTIQSGRVGDTMTATFSNTGTVSLTLSIVSGGANPADFVSSGTCVTGQTLAPAQACTLKYTFAPKASGTRTASVNVSSAAGVRTLTLTGSAKPGRGK